MNEHSRTERIVCWILTLALIVSMAVPPGIQFGAVGVSATGAEEPTSQTEPLAQAPSEQSENPISASTKTTVSEPAVATVTIHAENCTVTDAEGTPLGDSFQAEVGSKLTIKFVPAAGCDTATVKIGGSATITDAEDVITVTVREGLTIEAHGNDVTAPTMSNPVRTTSGWAKAATYTFTTEDNIGIISAQLIDSNGNTTELTSDAENTYHAEITANGTYTVRVADAEGLTAEEVITEEQIDPIAPAITKLERQVSGIVKSAEYLLNAEDELSGIEKVTVQIVGENEETLTANDDGSYTFTVTNQDTYIVTVYDNAGNTVIREITDEEIDIEGPTFTKITRNEDGWQNEKATYTICVEDSMAGLDSVTFGTADKDDQLLTENEDGSYTVTVTENGEYQIIATDKLGTTNKKTITENQIDKTAPVVKAPARSSQDWCQAAVYTIQAEDLESGIEVIARNDSGDILEVKQESDITYSVVIPVNGEYTITVTNGAGTSVQVSMTESKVDTTMPEIGDVIRHTDSWDTMAAYSFTVADNASGVQKVSVAVGDGEPVILKESDDKYSFTLTENGTFRIDVQDAAGNVESYIGVESRVDTSAPEITSLVRQESGWIDTDAAYTVVVQDSQVGMGCVSVTVDAGEPEVLTGENGVYSFTVKNNASFIVTAVDALGNSASLNGEETQIDKEAPVISAPVRSNSSWVTEVMYTFTVKDACGIKSVEASVNNENVPVKNDNGTYSFVMAENASYAITAVDNLGHASTITGTEANVDTVQPEIAELSRTEDGWTTSASYTFKAIDALSGIASIVVTDEENHAVKVVNTDGACNFALTANGTYTILVSDFAGNQVMQKISENYVDTSSPEILDLQRLDESWQQMTQYSFKVADTQSGIQVVTVRYGTEGEQVLRPDENGVYTFSVTENGKYEIAAVDAVGNKQTVDATEKFIDVTAPEVVNLTRNETGWATRATYTFSVSEAQSGLKSVAISIDGGEAQLMTPEGDGKYHFTLNKNCTFEIYVSDNLSNQGSKSGTESQIDTTAPAISEITRQESDWATSANYVFTVTDSASGVGKVTVVFGSGREKTLSGDGETYSFTMTENDSFVVTAMDTLGNTSTSQGKDDKVDITAPAIAAPERSMSGWATGVTYSFTLVENQSGVEKVTYTKRGEEAVVLTADSSGEYTFPVKENGTYTITATDSVGNASSVTVAESHIDTTAPDITALARTENDWAISAFYTFKVSDAQSGISSVSVTIGGKTQKLKEENGSYCFTMHENGSFEITATDAVGNVSTTNGREGNVDTTAPEILTPKRQSAGWSYSAQYQITVKEAQSGIASVTIQPEGGEMIHLQPTNNGVYIYTATDNNTYTITAVDAVGNSSSITFIERQVDFSSPSITNVKRDPDVWSQESTYTFTATDAQSGIQSVEVVLENRQIPLSGPAGDVYSFQSEANGEYRIIATDTVGNKTEIAVGENLIDLQAPVIHSVTPQQNWDADQNTVSMKVTDENELVSVKVFDKDGKEIAVTLAEDNLYQTVIRKNGDYTVKATDRAGNTTTQGFTVWHIDTEVPTTPVVTSSANEQWVNTDVTITAMATDSQSGVYAYWYSTDTAEFDPATWVKMTLGENKATATISAEMNSDCYVVAEDAMGRISETGKIHIRLDKTAPAELSAAYMTTEDSGYNRVVDGKYIYNDAFSFYACAADSASGVVGYDYRIETSDGISTDWKNVPANEAGICPRITNMADDVYRVWIRAYDLAGNCSEEYTVTADGQNIWHILENTPEEDGARSPAPDIAMTVNGEEYLGSWTKQDVVITVSGSSAISGIEFYEYAVNYEDPNMEDLSWRAVPVENGISQLTVSTDTNAYYSFRAVTYAGNCSRTTAKAVHIQKTGPVAATLTQEQATGTHGWYTQFSGYEVNLPEQNPHFAPVRYEIRYTYNDGEETAVAYDGTNAPAITKDGKWSFTVWTIDETGNSVTVPESTVVFYVDTKAPDALAVTLNGQDILNAAAESADSWAGVNYQDKNQTDDFRIFRNSTVTVKTAADGGDSGIDAVYYQIIANDADYDKDGAWTKMESDSVTLTPDSKCRLYFKAVDGAGNTTYFTGRSIIVDATAPVVTELEAGSQNKSPNGFYYDDATITVSIKEPSVGAYNTYSGISSIAYRVLMDGSVTQSGQLYPGGTPTAGEGGRVTDWTGSFVVDAQRNNSNNIIAEITVRDQAGNITTSYIREGLVKIDTDEPTMISSYDRNDIARTLGSDDIFTGSRTLTVIATERNLNKAESVVYVTDSDTGRSVAYQWSSSGNKHTATIPVTEDGHYKISAVITDNAGNKTTQMGFVDGTVAAGAFVIDNTDPVISVSYDNNNVHNGVYFNAARTATVKVTERNFDPNNILLQVGFVAENGNTSLVRTSSWEHKGSEHSATVVCSDNGEYSISVAGSDAVGHNAADARFAGVSATNFIVDTYIAAPVFTDVQNGSAYSGEIVPVVTVADFNLEDYSIHLYRTRLNETRKDIIQQIPDESILVTEVSNGYQIVMDAFSTEENHDGLYELVVTTTDKAGNTINGSVAFSVNRNGSVYVYSSDLIEVIGQSMQTLSKDLVITEYNPSGIVAGSAKVFITLDGVPVSDPIYTVEQKFVNDGQTGESGWYEYQYTISSENFTKDGQYEIIISTEDAAGNIPENTSNDMLIQFAIDTTAPELTSVTGMENASYKADSIDVSFTAVDNVALGSVVVYVDGKEVARWEDLTDFRLEEVFKISAGMDRHARIVITDAAGNVLDTDQEDFTPGYVMQDYITISTNFWLRFYANKPLFWGSIIGGICILTIAIFLLIKKVRKNTVKKTANNN